ncbi:MAG: DUF2695 domain-containing protein [Candidatus Abyssubacteria bacterium]|nr:DUF2695 domain-containing protein [Candidatus Abyssubacteria bacterium]
MDKETLLALGKHLKQFITLTAGPRIGMILPPTFKSEGCDHTFRRTTDWLTANGHDPDPSLKQLKRQGADCDCKVLTNIILRLDDEV